MTDKQSNQVDMYNAVGLFYTTNQTVIDSLAARADAFTQFNTNRAKLNTAISGQTLKTTGPTKDTQLSREALQNITYSILQPAAAWARVNNNNTLRDQFNVSLSDLKDIKDDTFPGYCRERYDLINGILPALADYGVTPAMFGDWDTAINGYVDALARPRIAVTTKSTKTQSIKSIISQTGKLLKEVIDPLMIVFRAQDPELFDGYTKARIIIDRRGRGSGSNPPPPAQTTNLKGNVTHAVTGVPLFKVEVTIMPTSGNITTLTDASGNYAANAIQLTASESVQVRFRLTGMEDRTETTTLQPGQNKVLNATMTPATAFFGHVVDTNGNTQAGAIVRLSNPDGMLEVQTDSNGNYSLPVPGLAQPESATLTAEATGMMPSSLPVTITPGEQQEQNFTLSPIAPPPPMP
ncbi:MAG: carboxypeptidase-like regulatory domain-containing protein [Flavobacteriales bacterium]|nr:carboxypeptidase-like regulatory domain-containing protein [Flavobacteriales bacterium]